jgi:hypothetical protein
MNEPAPNPATSPAAPLPDALDPGTLQLRDIHLPEPISWWPLAPGWWITLAVILLIVAAVFIARKIYLGKQLRRDINTELELIKQQYQQLENKPQLARDLSILLRRANISYYPESNIAGLTGEQWLQHLDRTNARPSADLVFQSETGRVLLSAPYLADDAELDFDAGKLIGLCESWLTSAHNKTQVASR